MRVMRGLRWWGQGWDACTWEKPQSVPEYHWTRGHEAHCRVVLLSRNFKITRILPLPFRSSVLKPNFDLWEWKQAEGIRTRRLPRPHFFLIRIISCYSVDSLGFQLIWASWPAVTSWLRTNTCSSQIQTQGPWLGLPWMPCEASSSAPPWTLHPKLRHFQPSNL